jgi:hypothetical protein
VAKSLRAVAQAGGTEEPGLDEHAGGAGQVGHEEGPDRGYAPEPAIATEAAVATDAAFVPEPDRPPPSADAARRIAELEELLRLATERPGEDPYEVAIAEAQKARAEADTALESARAAYEEAELAARGAADRLIELRREALTARLPRRAVAYSDADVASLVHLSEHDDYARGLLANWMGAFAREVGYAGTSVFMSGQPVIRVALVRSQETTHVADALAQIMAALPQVPGGRYKIEVLEHSLGASGSVSAWVERATGETALTRLGAETEEELAVGTLHDVLAYVAAYLWYQDVVGA